MRVILSNLEKFIKFEATAGIILLVAAFAAIIFANSDIAYLYHEFVHVPIKVQLGYFALTSSLKHFVNDGLMAVFFLVVSLEIKREMMSGHLATRSQKTLPLLAALSGVVIPAIIFFAFNKGVVIEGVSTMSGWAIPTATDIAFALGVLALFGSRVPTSLKVFLMALAIIDDLVAIVIIAVFYNHDLSIIALLSALAFIVILGMLNVSGVSKKTPYLCFGFLLWICVFNSGIHATLAGVVLGLFIPLTDRKREARSPLKELEKELHYLVAFLIVPLFAFANAGVSLAGISIASILSDPIAMGVMVGLFLGKQLGIFGTLYLLIKSGIAKMPENSTWGQIYGISIITGIGFTMSIFVGTLAFPGNEAFVDSAKMGVIFGSGLSAVIGYTVLQIACAGNRQTVLNKAPKQKMKMQVSKAPPKESIEDMEVDTSTMTKSAKKAYKAALKAEKLAIKIKEKAAAKAEKKALKAEKIALEKAEKKARMAEKKALTREKNRALKAEKLALQKERKKALKLEKKAAAKAFAEERAAARAKEKVMARAAMATQKIVDKTRREEAKAATKLAQAEKLAKAAEEIKARAAQKMQEQAERRANESVKAAAIAEKLMSLKALSDTKKIASLEKRASKEMMKAERIAKAAQRLESAKTSLVAKRISNFESKVAAKKNKKTKKSTTSAKSKKEVKEGPGEFSESGFVANRLTAIKTMFMAQKTLGKEMSKLKKEVKKTTKAKAKQSAKSRKPKNSA